MPSTIILVASSGMWTSFAIARIFGIIGQAGLVLFGGKLIAKAKRT